MLIITIYQFYCVQERVAISVIASAIHMIDTIISQEFGERREGRGGVRGLCDMVSVNLSINALAYINPSGTQYV